MAYARANGNTVRSKDELTHLETLDNCRFLMQPHLLVADAYDALTERLRKFFSNLGFRVEAAADGLECVEILRNSRPNVLVLDADLLWGGSDGVLAWMRDDASSSGMPVILMGEQLPPTFDTTEPVVCRLERPFDISVLHEAVISALSTEESNAASKERWQFRSGAPC